MEKLFLMSPSAVLPTEQDFNNLSALIATKADSSTVEALGTRVGTAEGAITDLGNNKMGWDVSTEGTPIVVDKDNNKISFQVAENGYLEVNKQ